MEKSNLEKLFTTFPANEEIEKEIINKFEQMECKIHKSKTLPLFIKNSLTEVTSANPCCDEFARKLHFEIGQILEKSLNKGSFTSIRKHK